MPRRQGTTVFRKVDVKLAAARAGAPPPTRLCKSRIRSSGLRMLKYAAHLRKRGRRFMSEHSYRKFSYNCPGLSKKIPKDLLPRFFVMVLPFF